MRNLTITRQKSFVACLATMKVYIEDAVAGDLAIKIYVKDEATGMPAQKEMRCRKLGVIKNGETATFSIGDEQAKVIVIADKLSKNYCNEYYTVPEGQEDVVLTGKNVFNPASGNAFQFDGVTDEVVLENRKKGTKKGLVVLLVAAVVGFVLGFTLTLGMLSSDGEAKEFSGKGMTITLTDEFRKQTQQNFTVCYGSKEVAVLALEEKFSLMAGLENYTLQQYGELVMKNSNISGSLSKSYGLTYFDYEANGYHYYAFVFKETDAFWLIQFAVEKENNEAYAQHIFTWASSIEFE